MFPHDSPLGKRLRVGDLSFEVVGTVEKRGRFLGLFSLDDVVFVPITVMAGQMVSRPDVRIDIKVASLAQLDDAKEELVGIMRKLRRTPPGAKNDFAINQQDAFIQNFNKVGGTVAAVGLFVTGLSLFVGGIGIMNIMFVSVTERTREIGIRRALGAKRRTILIQFLIESVLLCLMGGVIALVICAPMTLLVAMALPAALSPTIILLALGVAIATGVISGFMPAWRAAHMSPVDALRAE
jgi:putative ABC transport system permease protein